MTLSTTTVRATVQGSGTTGPFSFPFKVFAAADLNVQKIGTTGSVTPFNYPADYTVNGIGNASGGTLTLTVALAIGETLSILRAVPNQQPTSFRALGLFSAASHEDEFDRLTMLVQQHEDTLKRSARLPTAIDPATIAGMEMTPVTGRALGWSSPTTLSTLTIDSSAVGVPGGGRTVGTATEYLANNARFTVGDYGAIGNGIVDDATAFGLAQAGAGTSGIVSFGPRTHRLGSNVFLTSHLTLGPGVILKPDSGVSVFIEGGFTGSIGKHFDLSAGGKVLFNNIAIPEVFPEWFGAAADGVTDDTAALMAAINSVAFNNVHLSSPVTLSGATYLFSAINLGGTAGGGNGVWVRGAGNYATTLMTTATGGVVVSMNRPGCRLTDLRVQTAPSVTPGGTQYLIASTLGNACRLERLELIKYYNGIAASGVTMDHVSLDYGLAGGIGIDLSDSIGSILNDVRVAARYNASACFLLQGVVGQPDTNEFTNCSTGADVPTLWATYGTTNTGAIGIATSVRMAKQVGGFQPRWNRFVGCLFETQTNSIGTTTFDYQAGQDTKIIGGYIYGGYYAFAMLGATAGYLNDHVLEGTIVFGAYINGIYHNPADTTNPAPLTLSNCTIVDNSQNAIGGWPGVNLGANSRGFTMRGGTCGNTTFQTVRQQFGVAVDAAAQDYLIDVDSIDFTGNVSGPVSGLVPTLASAATLAPVSQAAFVSGVAAIGNITAPRRFRNITLIPTGLFTWTAAGNIAVAGSAVVGKALILRYVVATGKWYPSYTA